MGKFFLIGGVISLVILSGGGSRDVWAQDEGGTKAVKSGKNIIAEALSKAKAGKGKSAEAASKTKTDKAKGEAAGSKTKTDKEKSAVKTKEDKDKGDAKTKADKEKVAETAKAIVIPASKPLEVKTDKESPKTEAKKAEAPKEAPKKAMNGIEAANQRMANNFKSEAERISQKFQTPMATSFSGGNKSGETEKR